jgi:phosphoglycolate phosphatase
MRFKNIFLDLDGTLINSYRGIEYSMIQSLSHVCPDLNCNKIPETIIGPPVSEMFKQIVGSSNLNLIDDLTREFRSSYDNEGWKRTDIYDSVLETLGQIHLQGIKIFIVTNKPQKPTLRILNYFQMLNFFTDVVSPDTLYPSLTPKSAACQYIMRKYQINHQQTMLVGDSYDDAHAADTCGFTFVAASYGYGKADEYQKLSQSYKVSSFEELISLICV